MEVSGPTELREPPKPRTVLDVPDIPDEAWDVSVDIRQVTSMWENALVDDSSDSESAATTPPPAGDAPNQSAGPPSRRASTTAGPEGDFGRIAVEDDEAELEPSSSDEDEGAAKGDDMRRYFMRQQMQFLRAVEEGGVVTNVDKKEDKKKIDREQQGNEEFYTRDAVQKRAQIKSSPQMRRIIKQLWTLMPKSYVPEEETLAMSFQGHSFEVEEDGTVDTTKAFRKARAVTEEERKSTPAGVTGVNIDLVKAREAVANNGTPDSANLEEEATMPEGAVVRWQVRPPGMTPVINQDIYFALCARLFKKLVKEGTPKECLEVLKTEWRKDTGNGKFMTFQAFCNSIFDTIDVWCPSVDADKYHEFSEKVLKPAAVRVCVIDPETSFRLSSVYHHHKERRAAGNANVAFGRHMGPDGKPVGRSKRRGGAPQDGESGGGSATPRAAATYNKDRLDELAQSRVRGHPLDGPDVSRSPRHRPEGAPSANSSPREDGIRVPVQSIPAEGLGIGRPPTPKSSRSRGPSAGPSSRAASRASRASSVSRASNNGAADNTAPAAFEVNPPELSVVRIGAADPLLPFVSDAPDAPDVAEFVSLAPNDDDSKDNGMAVTGQGQKRVLVIEDSGDKPECASLSFAGATNAAAGVALLRKSAPTAHAYLSGLSERIAKPTEVRMCLPHGPAESSAVKSSFSVALRLVIEPALMRTRGGRAGSQPGSRSSSAGSRSRNSSPRPQATAGALNVLTVCLFPSDKAAAALAGAGEINATIAIPPSMEAAVSKDVSQVEQGIMAKLSVAGARLDPSLSKGGGDMPGLLVQEPTMAAPDKDTSAPDALNGTAKFSASEIPEVAPKPADDPDVEVTRHADPLSALEEDASNAPKLAGTVAAVPRSHALAESLDGGPDGFAPTYAAEESRARNDRYAVVYAEPTVAVAHKTAVGRKLTVQKVWREPKESVPVPPRPSQQKPKIQFRTPASSLVATAKSKNVNTMPQVISAANIAADVAPDDDTLRHMKLMVPAHRPTATTRGGRIVCIHDDKGPQGPRERVTLMGSVRPLAATVASQSVPFTVYEPYDAPYLLHKLTNQSESVVTRYVSQRVKPPAHSSRADCGMLESVIASKGTAMRDSVSMKSLATAAASGVVNPLRGLDDVDVRGTGGPSAKDDAKARNTSKLGKLRHEQTYASRTVESLAGEQKALTYEERTSLREAEALATALALRNADASPAASPAFQRSPVAPSPPAKGASGTASPRQPFTLASDSFAAPSTPHAPASYEERNRSHRGAPLNTNRRGMLGGAKILATLPAQRSPGEYVSAMVAALPEAGKPVPADGDAVASGLRASPRSARDEFDPRQWAATSTTPTGPVKASPRGKSHGVMSRLSH